MIEKTVVVSTASGWSLYGHPTFLDQLEKLTAQVELLAQKDPNTFREKRPQSGSQQ
jgi:hypothetical protein